jgi:CubicO group peptidase (beta-lactamase class C family)
MTKPVIALAALTLYDEGKFGLDDPIAKHCPEWAEPKVKEGSAIVAAKAAITPRMLMSHSSGLGYGGGQAAAAMICTTGHVTPSDSQFTSACGHPASVSKYASSFLPLALHAVSHATALRH